MDALKKVVVLVGPTAVGKTDLSIDLALALNGEVVSADSVQIFKGLNIGSAKPTKEEMRDVPHHLIDFLPATSSYSVGAYEKDAKAVIADILSRNKTPIVTGGTGLYINALLYEMDFGNSETDEAFRKEMEALATIQGVQAVHSRLVAVDPSAAESIHPNNLKRVIRALEINHMTGQNMGQFSKDPVPTQAFDFVLLGLKRARMKLYGRINQRVELMLASGLLEEVKALKNIGLDDSFQSMQGIGYKEVLGFLSDQYSYDVMVSLLKQNSRRYAKRQMTWFRRYQDMNWIDLDEYESNQEAVQAILSKLK